MAGKKSKSETNLDSQVNVENDQEVEERVKELVQKLQQKGQKHYFAVFEELRDFIRVSTQTLTSVPKPLKYLTAHYKKLQTIYGNIKDNMDKKSCADILSIVAMHVDEGKDCLKYRLLGSTEDIDTWGYEYIRHLSRQTVEMWKNVDQCTRSNRSLLQMLTEEIVEYQMLHNAETEACDLLMEIDKTGLLNDYVTAEVHEKVCLYLTSCAPYLTSDESIDILNRVVHFYRLFGQFPQALRFAISLNDRPLIESIFFECPDRTVRKQLALILAQQQIPVSWPPEKMDEEMEGLKEIVSNLHLNEYFLHLAGQLEVLGPKAPEDVYKTYIEANSHKPIEKTARLYLADAFVNGFINAAFKIDKMIADDSLNTWLYNTMEQGYFSATASLGLLYLWHVEEGVSYLTRFLESTQPCIKAGALLALGMTTSRVHTDYEPAKAVLSECIPDDNPYMKIGAYSGLGVAYAGTNDKEVLDLIFPAFSDPLLNMEVIGNAALACGMIAVGTCNKDVISILLQTMEKRNPVEASEPYSRYLALGFALTFLGRQEYPDTLTKSLLKVAEPLGPMATMLLDICAYAGSHNVLKIQHLLHICSRFDATGEKATDQNLFTQTGLAVLGIGLIAMGEEVGSDMTFRVLKQLLQYGDLEVRCACPLALALISVSNPKLNVQDIMSKFSHDEDDQVAQNSILAMGIVGAGTNNARLAAMLRQLAVYHARHSKTLFTVRVAQGLTHLGKGTLTLSPYHSDRTLMSPVAVAGLLTVLVSCLDIRRTITGRCPYMLCNLVTAIQPRILVTFDENLQPLSTIVRIGQPVDIVGKPGVQRTITGFNTYTTPVMLTHEEKAELATDEYIPLSPILEGFVILRKNPDYVAE